MSEDLEPQNIHTHHAQYELKDNNTHTQDDDVRWFYFEPSGILIKIAD